ncbi:MAG: CBS domain-containing protein [Aeromicrobium sp.]
MRVSDVMSSKGSATIFTIRPGATLSDLLDALAEHNVGALVVTEDGTTMLGIVSERDVVRKIRDFDDPKSVAVEEIMTADVRVCAPEDSFGSLMAIMTEHRIRHVPVLDGDQLVGVVSIGDAVKQRMDQLEFERDQLNNYVSRGGS